MMITATIAGYLFPTQQAKKIRDSWQDISNLFIIIYVLLKLCAVCIIDIHINYICE